MADKAAWEPRYTLEEAAQRYFDGSMNKRSLSRLIRKGRLRAERINGRFYVTETAILAMCHACQHTKQSEDTPCGEKSQPGSTSGAPVMSTQQFGSSGMERERLARVQAQRTLQRLKKPSATISPTDTPHQVVSLRREPS
jgi:hypothetical protein